MCGDPIYNGENVQQPYLQIPVRFSYDFLKFVPTFARHKFSHLSRGRRRQVLGDATDCVEKKNWS